MASKSKNWILALLRYGLCVVAIAFLVRQVTWYDYVKLTDGARHRLVSAADDHVVIRHHGQEERIPAERVARVAGGELLDIEYGIASVVRDIDAWNAFLAFAIFFPATMLQSLRLIWMLAMQEVRLSFWQSVKLSFAGNFFNFALPGTTGGDLIKAYYVTRFTHRKTEAVTAIFLDRAIGLLGLVLLAGTMILLNWDAEKFGNMAYGLGLLVAGLAVGVVMIFSSRMRAMLKLSELVARLPAGQQLLRVGRATVAMRRHLPLVVLSLLNTVALQSFVMIGAYFMAMAMGMKGTLAHYMIYVPVGYLIAAIPILPPQAFGVMEWFYVLFFARTGLSSVSQAVAFALALRLIQLFWALPGVLVPLFGAHMPTRHELEELETPDAADAPPRAAGPLPPAPIVAAPGE
ncbi:MAG: hypothetical protein CHACPFDD_03962 [Phycisphaerae bacterium]|nr:hypothetical protein [Phycisphaerae bacterium]